MEALADSARTGIKPAAILVYCTFVLVFVVGVLNEVIIKGNHDALPKAVPLAFNAIVMIFGLALGIAAVVGIYRVDDSCPPGQDCTNYSMVAVGFLGAGIFIAAGKSWPTAWTVFQQDGPDHLGL